MRKLAWLKQICIHVCKWYIEGNMDMSLRLPNNETDLKNPFVCLHFVRKNANK